MEHTQNTFPRYASVLIDGGPNKPLDYGITAHDATCVQKGTLVSVPVRGHLRQGFVIAVKETPGFPKVQPINKVLNQIPQDLFELALWISRYYYAPLRQALKMMLPASVRKNHSHKEQYCIVRVQTKEHLRKICESLQESHPAQARVLMVMLQTTKEILLTELVEKADVSKSPVETLVKKGFLRMHRMRIDRSPLVGEEYFKTHAKTLNHAQQAALEKITATLGVKFSTHLLHGITGSGKTEVYLQAIEKALEKGLGTIMLIPEISLTTQTIERFRSRFNHQIAVLHHRLSDGERFDEWHRIRRGEARIVIGARSALFSPVADLGLIVVDEEHDNAYKQSEEQPCYHARDVAVVRGKMTGATVVLGTATPSLESYYNAQQGKYQLSTLDVRATKASLPTVRIVDMKKEYEKAKGYTSFSELLIDGIKKRLERGEQTILFLNRRGYNTSLSCKGCGHIFQCPHCDVAMTYHQAENTLFCHLCGTCQCPPPRHCTSCGNVETLKYRGVGTELVEKALHALFPDIRTLRIDGDTTRHKGSHERFFRQFSTGKADVMVGTQMVTKGLHFPSVTLVAVLNSDGNLHIPDFRASERVFQLITQVAGRAGRGNLPGEVIVQTQMPDNPTILAAAKQDYEAFYASEIESRKLFDFPPFSHLVKLTFSGADPHETEQTAKQIQSYLTKTLGSAFLVHPVVVAGYAKIKDLFRFQCLIRGKSVYPIPPILSRVAYPTTVKMHIDVDPLSTYF